MFVQILGLHIVVFIVTRHSCIMSGSLSHQTVEQGLCQALNATSALFGSPGALQQLESMCNASPLCTGATWHDMECVQCEFRILRGCTSFTLHNTTCMI